MCRVDDNPASIRLNLALYDIAPVEDYNHRISIFIKMNNPTENGLSSNEEYPILCDIEDEVINRLETLEDIFVGTVKSQGRLELHVFTKEREIDHWLYFYSEESLNLATKKLEELGYSILSSKKMEDEADTYQINISRMDNVVFNHINEVVWELVEIAESLNGYYDGWGCTVVK